MDASTMVCTWAAVSCPAAACWTELSTGSLDLRGSHPRRRVETAASTNFWTSAAVTPAGAFETADSINCWISAALGPASAGAGTDS